MLIKYFPEFTFAGLFLMHSGWWWARNARMAAKLREKYNLPVSLTVFGPKLPDLARSKSNDLDHEMREFEMRERMLNLVSVLAFAATFFGLPDILRLLGVW